MATYIEGDIHDVIKTLETNTIDLIYTNPPYGTTENEWDKALNWEELWKDIWRILKPNGVVVIHASKPFSYKLIQSQTPKYNYNWIKTKPTNFFHAKKQPLRKVEEIYVFYKKKHTYNPQMIGDDVITSVQAPNKYYGNRSNSKTSTHIGRYPTDVLEFKREVRGGKTISDDMIDFFIKTYSNENDLVLDMTTHNKVVGNRVIELKREFIGIDINPII
tara:strand:- start:84 stop:737 length:654 start_codon:yes stop_codon:yes gene_type:complete